MIMYLEFDAVGWFWLSVYSLFVMILQIFLMIALRSHYSIDMFAAVLFAHYLWMMSERYSYIIDWHIFKIPLEKRMALDRGLSI